MNPLIALWICANSNNIATINGCDSGYEVPCANNSNFHKSSHLLCEQPSSWPVREKLNKGIGNALQK